MRTKILSLFIAVAVIIGVVPIATLTVSAETYSGTCGEDLTWTLDTDTGVLEISGMGEMAWSGNNPWYNYRSDIKTVIIGNGVTNIRGSAFSGCANLSEITIPVGVTQIGSNAFSGCTDLTAINVDEDNVNYSSVGGVMFNKDKTTIVQYPVGKTGSYTIPSSVTDIGNYAFSGCTGLTEITIPNSVTIIGNSAFSGCTNLTEITIPDSVTDIGDSVFYGCANLTSITIPDSVISIGYNAFYNCTGLTSITISDSVTSIGSNAFYNSPWLNSQPDGVVYAGKVAYIYKGSMPTNTSITLKQDTKSISGSAFDGCTNLTSITIPNSVTNIGSSAFSGCTSLTEITIPIGVTDIENFVFYNCTKLTKVTIPNSITSIGSRAFMNCTNLSVITIPNGVTNIGESAFDGCKGLTSITIPDSVKSISNYVFQNCSNLAEISIPDSVESIESGVFAGTAWLNNQPNGLVYVAKIAYLWKGDMPANTSVTLLDTTKAIAPFAFRNLKNLVSITIPDSVESIGTYALYDTGLTKVTIPDSVTSVSIGGGVFYDCKSLTEATVGNGVTNIGAMFYGCTNLTKVTIGNSVASINNAFRGCSSLKSITFKSAIPPDFARDAFSDTVQLSSIYVPMNSKSLYQAEPELSNYNIIGLCDVAFNSQGGTAVATLTDIIEGNKITEPTAPTKEHYTFDGWYKESDCINEWDFDIGTVTDIMTLYAKWIPDTYGITYHLNGGTNPPNPPLTYTYGTSTDLPVPARTGYTFDGWYEDIDFYSEKLSETGTTRAGTLVLYAKWEVRTYTITYNANGGVGAPSPQDKTHNVFLVLSSSMPIFTGHTFLGWAANDPNSSAPNYMSGVVNYFTDNADVTLYAVWQCNLHICENCEKICPDKCACPICECDCINKACHDCGVCEVCNPPQTTTTTETTTPVTTTTTAEVTTTTAQTTAHTTTAPNTSTPTDTTTAPNTSTPTDATTTPNTSTPTDMTTSASTTDIPATTTTGTGTDTTTANTTTPATTTTPEETTTPTTTTTPPVTCDCDEISCNICNPDGEFLALGDIDGENGVTIFDALEILKYLVGMGNAMDDNPEALRAGIISDNGISDGKPTIFCALEVLKYLVSMDSRVDGIHIHGTPIE